MRALQVRTGGDPKRLVIGVVQRDVDEVGVDEAARERGEAIETIVGVEARVQELRDLQQRRRDLRLVALRRMEARVLDRDRRLHRDAGGELALKRRERSASGPVPRGEE